MSLKFEVKVANFTELITTSIVPNMRTKNINSWLPVQDAVRTLRSAFDNDIRRAMRIAHDDCHYQLVSVYNQ